MAKVLIGNFKGPKGDKGDKGDVGTAATIQVGTTQTVQPEENAEVTNSGTTSAAVLNFKIPRGADGMTDLVAEYEDDSSYTCEPTSNAPVILKEILGKTEQGADPSPENPQDIHGVGGKAGGSEFSTAVETQGRNLFDASKITTTSAGGATVTNNGDGSFTVSGQSSEGVIVVSYIIQHNDTKNILKAGTLKLGTDKNTNPYFFFQVCNEDKSILKELHNSPANAITSIEITESDLLDDTLKIWSGFYFSSNILNPVTPGTIFPMVYQSGDSTYQPYHHTTLTIPLTAPLFNGDKICYVKPGESYVNADGETVTADGVTYGVYRENASVVFDGSEDENPGKSTSGENVFSCTITNKVGSSIGGEQYLKCNKLTTTATNVSASNMPDNSIKESGEIGVKAVLFNISEAGTTVESLRTWLSTNPLTVVYRLAEPYFEPFTDQSIFYDLRTDDTLTYIYSNDPIEPNITVDVAKNSTGGILLESYATAQKNALAESDNASRLAEVEQQLLTLNTTVSTMGGGSE